MRVIIAGGRDFGDYELLVRKCEKIFSQITDEIEIMSGTAIGADRLGERFAMYRQLTIHRFPADWDTHGKSAGYKRNEEMAIFGDALIAFWDGKSKGTKHMIDIAESKALDVRIIRY